MVSRGALLLAAVVTCACSARTSISAVETEQAGGSGGGTTGGTGGIGSGGSGGGPVDPCATFGLDGNTITSLVARGGGAIQSGSALVAPNGQSVMSFVTRRSALGVDGDVLATTFDAWGAWPTTQGPLRFIVPDVRGDARATRGYGNDVLLALPFASGAGPDLALPAVSLAVAPGTDYVEAPTTRLYAFGLAPTTTSFVTRSATRAHVGMLQAVDDGFVLSRAQVDRNGNIVEGPRNVTGCADRPTKSASIAVTNGFLTATSSGSAHASCVDGDGPLLPPTQLQVDLSNVGPPTLTAEIFATEPYATVQMVPSSDGGAWVISQTDGSTSLTYPPVAAMRFTADGISFATSTNIVPDGLTGGPIASAAFGDGFAVARFGDTSENPTIVVEIFDDDALLRGRASIIADTNSVSAMSIVVSPNADALVLGWTSDAPEGIARAARFACQPL